MSAPSYIPSEFRFISPKQRFRRCLCVALACLGIAGMGAAMMFPPGTRNSDAAVAPADQLPRAETIPAVSPVGYAIAVDAQPASEHGAQVITGKPSCLGESRDGNCVSFQLPKVRMVRVPRAASVGQKANPAKTAAALKTAELDKGVRETNKPQKSVHYQNQRRRSTASRSEARLPRWATGGTPGEYGGFARNFW